MIDEILAKKVDATSPVSNIANGLTTRKQSDLDRFNNNKLFDEGGGDDDL
jgi:hypothetical protein